MEFILATVLYPLLLALLALAAGLLVDRIAAGRVPGFLIAVVGLALVVATSELFSYWEATAPLAPWAVLALAIAGAAAGLPRLRRARPDWWLVAASVGVYVMVCAPVLLHGEVTLAGYLLDTTVAFHLAGSEYLLEHSRNFSLLPESSFRQTMERYFGINYPGGGQTLLGSTGRLVGTDAIWLYQPLLSMLLAFCVAPLYYMARAASLARPAAAVAALVAAAPALVYAYAQMGAIKELAVLPFVLLLGPAILLLPRWIDVGVRGAVVPAVVGAAGVAAIGIAFLPWLAAAAVAAIVVMLVTSRSAALGSRRDVKRLALWSATFVVVLVALGLPTFGPLGDSLTLARSLSTANELAVADPGNLLRPLLPVQGVGIWLGGSHRIDPHHVGWTYALIGVAIAAGFMGVLWLLRRRLWGVLAFAAVMGVVWLTLTYRGTAWTDAKLLVITSPVVVLLAAIGLNSIWRAGRRFEALAIAAALVGGVLWSNALAYHHTNLAPSDRYRELLEIGDDYAGQGPTLVPEFDEFALYALWEMAPAGAGFSFKPASLATLRDGTPTGYGHSYDVDSLPLDVVEENELIVARRRPDSSRPPANFELAERGDYYDVWRRTAEPEVLVHEPVVEPLQAAATVPCGRVRSLAARARDADATLHYVPRPRSTAIAGPQIENRPTGWPEVTDAIALATPGIARKRFDVPSGGRYDIWLQGDFARALTVSVDAEPIGVAENATGNEGNYAGPFEVELDAGEHVLELERGGGSVAPADAGPSRLVAVVVEPARDEPLPVVEVQPTDWRTLCDRPVDWIEVARGS